MSDTNPAPDTSQDTPNIATPENEGAAGNETDTQQEINWQERYANLQPEYTRASQEAAQLREQQEQTILAVQIYHDPSADPEQRQLAAQILGMPAPEVEQDEDSDPYESRFTQMEQQLQALLGEREETQQINDLGAYVRQQMDEVEKEIGRDFNEFETNLIGQIAFYNFQNGLGPPDVKAVYEQQLAPYRSAVEKQLIAGKRNTPAPNGSPANKHVDLTDPQQRRAHMLAQLEAANQEL